MEDTRFPTIPDRLQTRTNRSPDNLSTTAAHQAVLRDRDRMPRWDAREEPGIEEAQRGRTADVVPQNSPSASRRLAAPLATRVQSQRTACRPPGRRLAYLAVSA